MLGAGSTKVACKILMSKNLEVKSLRTHDLGQDDAVSSHRHCLDYDCALEMVGARLDVTWGLWKNYFASAGLRPGLSYAPLWDWDRVMRAASLPQAVRPRTLSRLGTLPHARELHRSFVGKERLLRMTTFCMCYQVRNQSPAGTPPYLCSHFNSSRTLIFPCQGFLERECPSPGKINNAFGTPRE